MKNKRTCDYIAEAIQNEILSGRMEAGQPLRQEELSEKLGYSRMPVREALQILEEQGLVRRLATRHVVVADFSRRNIEEIFDMVGNVEKTLQRCPLNGCTQQRAKMQKRSSMNLSMERSQTDFSAGF